MGYLWHTRSKFENIRHRIDYEKNITSIRNPSRGDKDGAAGKETATDA